MDEFFLKQKRLLDDELANIRSLCNEIASMAETASNLQISMTVARSPDIMNGVREAKAFLKEAEAQLSSHLNNSSHETAEVQV